jgi:hypothetical protein
MSDLQVRYGTLSPEALGQLVSEAASGAGWSYTIIERPDVLTVESLNSADLNVLLGDGRGYAGRVFGVQSELRWRQTTDGLRCVCLSDGSRVSAIEQRLPEIEPAGGLRAECHCMFLWGEPLTRGPDRSLWYEGRIGVRRYPIEWHDGTSRPRADIVAYVDNSGRVQHWRFKDLRVEPLSAGKGGED